MALFSECTPQCAQKELDTADIVRDAWFRQLGLNCRDYGLFGYSGSIENLTDSAACVREHGGNEM
jgi:hypothetical protein